MIGDATVKAVIDVEVYLEKLMSAFRNAIEYEKMSEPQKMAMDILIESEIFANINEHNSTGWAEEISEMAIRFVIASTQDSIDVIKKKTQGAKE